MKKIMFLATTVIMFVVVTSSCKKSDSGSTSIVGKWTYLKSVYTETNITTNTVVTNTTTTFNNGSYADFRTDGKMYSYNSTSGYRDTLSYNVSGNNITVGTATDVIKLLDANNLQVYWTQTTGNLKDEETSYFSR